MRPLVAGAAAVLLAAAGGIVLGEQPLEGITVVVAGALFGMAIAEVIVSIARYGDGYLAGAAALLTGAGMVLALYIETGHDLRAAPGEAWIAVVLGAALAALWLRSAARRGRRTPQEP